MALRDTLRTQLNALLDAEAAKGLVKSSSISILPANGPGDWSGGFVLKVTTDRGLDWTSPAFPTPGRPITDELVEEVKEGIVREINRRVSR